MLWALTLSPLKNRLFFQTHILYKISTPSVNSNQNDQHFKTWWQVPSHPKTGCLKYQLGSVQGKVLLGIRCLCYSWPCQWNRCWSSWSSLPSILRGQNVNRNWKGVRKGVGERIERVEARWSCHKTANCFLHPRLTVHEGSLQELQEKYGRNLKTTSKLLRLQKMLAWSSTVVCLFGSNLSPKEF